MAKAEKFAKMVPDPYILVMGMILLSAVATYLIPAGKYKRETSGGTETVVPGTYHHLPQQPVSWTEILLSIQHGLIDAASIIFFAFLVGGAIGIILATGTIHAFLTNLIVRVKDTDYENLLIIIFPLIFGTLGGVAGSFEGMIPFTPLMVFLALSLGYDAIVGCSLVLLGVTAGYTAAPLSPFTVGVAQSIAGLPLFSGMWYRWIFWAISVAVTIAYIYRYARKVKADSSQSLVSDIEYDKFRLQQDPSEVELEKSHYLVLAVFLTGIILLLIGVTKYDWYINEIATLFLMMGFASGLVYRMSPNDIIENFIDGAKDLTYAALIIGFARGILVVLQEGSILDTIVYTLIQPLQQLPDIISAMLIVPTMSILNFFIPSGSGQAAVVIPILAPMADVLGIPRQVMILAFQYGDGFSNMFLPTVGATMAMISMANIPYGRWLMYTAKLLAIQTLIGMIAVGIAVLINLGPT